MLELRWKTFCCAVSALLAGSAIQAQTGHVLDAVGAVNQSMGGAGTAMPLDAIGALHWNPASISGLKQSEMAFSFMGFAPESHLSSRVDPNAFGPGFPPATLRGSTKSEVDISPIPSLAVVYRDANSPWTFGLGGFGIGGFGVDYPTDPNNPILTPQPPLGGMGFGAIYSQFQLLQFCPTASYQFENGWSVGLSPTVNWSTLSIDPFSAATPNANGTYPSAAHSDSAWGLGFQVGVYYESCESPWSFGASYKSSQWFETYTMNSYDHLGAPRTLDFNMDYPSITSLGLGYRGLPHTKIAADMRYIDYENTAGFETAGFDPTGAVTGFGWESVWVFATGVEYTISPRLQWRVGYTYNTSPINSQTMFYNSPAPAIIQHHLSTGFSYELGQGWQCSVAYHHGFKNRVSGMWYHPVAGPMAASQVTSTLSTDSIVFGVSKRF
ncbi:MAG: OmpP1/FadL family transporter [Planctomycetaceae bacterium]